MLVPIERHCSWLHFWNIQWGSFHSHCMEGRHRNRHPPHPQKKKASSVMCVQLGAQLDLPLNGCILQKREASHQFVLIEWSSNFTQRIDLQHIFFSLSQAFFCEKSENSCSDWHLGPVSPLVSSLQAARRLGIETGWPVPLMLDGWLVFCLKEFQGWNVLGFVSFIHGPRCLCVFWLLWFKFKSSLPRRERRFSSPLTRTTYAWQSTLSEAPVRCFWGSKLRQEACHRREPRRSLKPFCAV